MLLVALSESSDPGWRSKTALSVHPKFRHSYIHNIQASILHIHQPILTVCRRQQIRRGTNRRYLVISDRRHTLPMMNRWWHSPDMNLEWMLAMSIRPVVSREISHVHVGRWYHHLCIQYGRDTHADQYVHCRYIERWYDTCFQCYTRRLKDRRHTVTDCLASHRAYEPSFTHVVKVVPSLRYPGSQTHLLKPGRCSSGRQWAL